MALASEISQNLGTPPGKYLQTSPSFIVTSNPLSVHFLSGFKTEKVARLNTLVLSFPLLDEVVCYKTVSGGTSSDDVGQYRHTPFSCPAILPSISIFALLAERLSKNEVCSQISTFSVFYPASTIPRGRNTQQACYNLGRPPSRQNIFVLVRNQTRCSVAIKVSDNFTFFEPNGISRTVRSIILPYLVEIESAISARTFLDQKNYSNAVDNTGFSRKSRMFFS